MSNTMTSSCGPTSALTGELTSALLTDSGSRFGVTLGEKGDATAGRLTAGSLWDYDRSLAGWWTANDIS